MFKIEWIIPVIVSFVIAIAIAPILIPMLRRLKVGQTVRDDGPQSHLKKNGTPTMGGIIFLISTVATAMFFVKDNKEMIPVFVLTIGMGLVGFLDDYIKVVLKRSMGLKPLQKLLLQFLITAVFAYYVHYVLDIDLAMKIPFFKGVYLDFGIFNIPILFLVVLGTDNATNLTDGLDGLSTSVTIVTAAFFTITAILQNCGIAPFGAAFAGGLMAFLLYNAYPAKVMMGDTGSLALGGFLASVAYIMQMPLFLIIVGIIYVAEAVSVILQVSYFKLTHGKRIFRMAPIHHHFELCGWSETNIVAVFTVITILFSLVAFLGIW